MGKSTQARRLAGRLQRKGVPVLCTREPGGTAFAERIRSLLLSCALPPHAALAETLLFYAARADHVEQLVIPALRQGTWVVCDRFSDSTRVYQGHAGGLEEGRIESLDGLVLGPLRPDLTFILDLPPEIGLARRSRRDAGDSGGETGDKYEARSLEYHARVREGFLDIARREPHRCRIIDASMDEEAVAEAIWAAARDRFTEELG